MAWKMPKERAFRCDKCNGRRPLDQATLIEIKGTEYAYCVKCTTEHNRKIRAAERDAKRQEKGAKGRG